MTTTPPAWANAPLVLYHGTIERHMSSVLAEIDLRLAEARNDFGPGFYTTTLLRQAQRWAEDRADRYGDRPAVIAYQVSRDTLANLETLWFVRGEHENEEYWSFVFHCRTTAREAFHHGRAVNDGLYDIVVGPVAAFWKQKVVASGYDQVSFHTARAVGVLNACEKRRIS